MSVSKHGKAMGRRTRPDKVEILVEKLENPNLPLSHFCQKYGVSKGLAAQWFKSREFAILKGQMSTVQVEGDDSTMKFKVVEKETKEDVARLNLIDNYRSLRLIRDLKEEIAVNMVNKNNTNTIKQLSTISASIEALSRAQEREQQCAMANVYVLEKELDVKQVVRLAESKDKKDNK